MIVAGMDLGSRAVKAVLMNSSSLLATESSAVNDRVDRLSRRLLASLRKKAGVSRWKLAGLATTGYGRKAIKTQAQFPDVLCLARALHHLAPEVRTVLDLGGLIIRAIAITPQGTVADYLENEKCAAGSGRFLEMVAEVLEMPLSEVGSLALSSRRPLPLTSQCVVFAESELISQLNTGAPVADLLAGLHLRIAERAAGLATKLGFQPPWAITGGVARNLAVRKFLEEALGSSAVSLPIEADLIASLGAGLLLQDQLSGKA